MKRLLGYNSLLSERKSKQQLNRRMNVKTTLWPNKFRRNRLRRVERRATGKCQSQKKTEEKIIRFLLYTDLPF